MICTPCQIYSGDQIKKNEMGGARKVHTEFWWEA